MAAILPVWGIDVGQCSLKAIKLQLTGEQVEMLAVDVVEHETILSQSDAEAPAIIAKAIDTFAARNDLQNCRIVVGVPGQQTLTKFTKMPPVEAKKIPDMVRYEAGQQIPFDMEEVVWDYHVFTEPESPDIEVGIFAIRKELIRSHLSHFLERGIEPYIVQTTPIASYNAIKYDRAPSGDKAMILLDMGALTTDLIVIDGSTIWSRPLPIGGNRFTEALVTAFKIPFKKAEDLKRKAASSKYARQIFQAMRPVFADLVSEIQRSIGFYTSTHRDAHIVKVLGMGSAFKLPGLQKFLQQNLQLEVEKLAGFNKLNPGVHKEKPEFTQHVMSFAVAYGLALQGLGAAPVVSSLLPPEVRRTLLWRKKRTLFAVSAACLGLAATTVWLKNVSAAGQVEAGIGPDVQVRRYTSTQAAEQDLINNSPSGQETPYQFATRVSGAIQHLQGVLNGLQGQSTDDKNRLTEMAKLLDNNFYLPRITDFIHRAFAAVLSDRIKAVKSADDYVELASQLSRTKRDEVWIDKLWIEFDPKDPEGILSGERRTAGRKVSGKPGWAVRIGGRTTRSDPDKWFIEQDGLQQQLERLGRQPNQGFHLVSVQLTKVISPKVSPTKAAAPAAGGGAFNAPAGGRFGMAPPGPGGGLAPGPQGGKVGQAHLRDLEYRGDKDPLTKEDMTTDKVFEMQLVIYKENTPESLLPKDVPGNEGKAGKDSKEVKTRKG